MMTLPDATLAPPTPEEIEGVARAMAMQMRGDPTHWRGWWGAAETAIITVRSVQRAGIA